jgi:DNA polymerase III subunit delta
MDIKSPAADRFLKALPAGLSGVLFHGTDPGLVFERAASLAQSLASDAKSPGEIIRLEEGELADDPARLRIELTTIPMFGGRKIVRLRAERLKPELIADLLGAGPLEGVLIVEAGNLKPDSKLRTLFAHAANAAAVACYPDDESSLTGLIDEVFHNHKLRIAQDVREDLLSLMGADRTLSRNELEKLALYVGDSAEVTSADVEAIVGDASVLTLDQILHATAAGDPKAALICFDRAMAAGDSPQTVILGLQRHYLRLHMLAAGLAAGKGLDGLLRQLRPPLHFKAQPLVQSELRLWPLARLARALAAIQVAAKAARLTPMLEREFAERLICDLAELAAKTRAV